MLWDCLVFSLPSPRISRFSKDSGSFHWKMVFRNQELGARKAHIFKVHFYKHLNFIGGNDLASNISQGSFRTNSYICLCDTPGPPRLLRASPAEWLWMGAVKSRAVALGSSPRCWHYRALRPALQPACGTSIHLVHLHSQGVQSQSVRHIFKMSMNHLGNIKSWFNDSPQVLLNYEFNILDIFLHSYGPSETSDWGGSPRNQGVIAKEPRRAEGLTSLASFPYRTGTMKTNERTMEKGTGDRYELLPFCLQDVKSLGSGSYRTFAQNLASPPITCVMGKWAHLSGPRLFCL